MADAPPKLPLKYRIAIWFATRKLRKEILHMTPLPWWVNVVSLLGTVGTVVAGVAHYLPPEYALIGAAVGAVLTSLAHALTGANAPAPIAAKYPVIPSVPK